MFLILTHTSAHHVPPLTGASDRCVERGCRPPTTRLATHIDPAATAVCTDCANRPRSSWCDYGECYADCLEDDHCPEGDICSEGACEPAPPADASAPPDAEELDGDE